MQKRGVMGQERCEDREWYFLAYLFSVLILLHVGYCCRPWKYETNRPSSSRFTFTEGMLLVLYGVCYCLVVRLALARYTLYLLHSLSLFHRVTCAHLHYSSQHSQGSHMRMWIFVWHPLRAIQEIRDHLLYFRHCNRHCECVAEWP